VERAITLASFVPEEQEEKLVILEDIGFLFDTPPQAPGQADGPPPTTAEQVQALRDLHDYLAASGTGVASASPGRATLGASIERLREHLRVFIERVEAEGSADEALADLERVLLASLPDQLARLRRSLAAEAISMAGLPPDLVARMRTPSGISRVQVFPSGNLRELSDFRHFVDEVQSFAPMASGVPINLVEFGRVTGSSFRQALITAVVLIVGLLWVLWRRVSNVLLVMTPLCLGAGLTVASMVLLDIRFDFTNVIVIPLLFGIGVDSGIHLVQRSREGLATGQNLLATSTSRAVFYSAFTTVVSFGTLSLSGHNGMKGLGITLTLGLIYTVASILILLPALLDLVKPSDGRGAADGFPKRP